MSKCLCFDWMQFEFLADFTCVWLWRLTSSELEFFFCWRLDFVLLNRLKTNRIWLSSTIWFLGQKENKEGFNIVYVEIIDMGSVGYDQIRWKDNGRRKFDLFLWVALVFIIWVFSWKSQKVLKFFWGLHLRAWIKKFNLCNYSLSFFWQKCLSFLCAYHPLNCGSNNGFWKEFDTCGIHFSF